MARHWDGTLKLRLLQQISELAALPEVMLDKVDQVILNAGPGLGYGRPDLLED